jgi:hypothetical protein
VLQHSSVHTDLQTVLQLCCASKDMRAAVLQHCKGLLPVTFRVRNLQHAERLAAWIVQQGQLMGSLRILPAEHHTEPQMYGFTTEAVESVLDDAQLLIAAALARLQLQLRPGQQGGVQLRALELVPVGNAVQTLLQLTPSDKLLRLCMPKYRYLHASVNPSSIAALSQLQSLEMGPVLQAEQLLQVLPALTALTFLRLPNGESGGFTAEQRQQLHSQLPTQLKALKLYLCTEDAAPVPLQLAHLSALTSLKVGRADATSQLPQQLLELSINCGRSVQPVLGCQQLQQLDCCWSSADAAELSKLASLAALTDLSFSYMSRQHQNAVNAAVPAWPLLAGELRSLHIEGVRPGHLQAASLQQIKLLSNLTYLAIQCRNFEDHWESGLPVTPTEFADVLSALTELRTLELVMEPGDHLLLQEPAAAVAADGAGAAAAADGVVMQDTAAPAAVGAGDLQQQGNAQQDDAGEAGKQLDDDMNAQMEQLLQLQQQQQEEVVDPHPPSPNMLPVMTAISGMPHLHSLELKCSGLDLISTEPLTKLTQLTRLTMSGCDFDDAACISLVLSLTGLRRLSLSGSDLVSDASLVAISKAVAQLTELKLSYCSQVSNRGVVQLTRLQELKLLHADEAQGVSGQAVAAVLQYLSNPWRSF